MKFEKVEDLYDECRNCNYHVSLTWQRITNYSVEIYKGYQRDYVKIYYSDGHVTLKEAIKKGLKFMRRKNKENNFEK